MSGLVAWALVAPAGAAGAVLRLVVDTRVRRAAGGAFPWGTLAVNVSGSLLLGLLTGLGVAGGGLLVAGTALLGSYTTFSTWMLETGRLAETGEGRLAALNVVVPMSAGLAAAGLGWALGAALG
ncbi:MAG: fluoride efflux transporter CrcB [Thermoleophilia bacterium]|nr:fluoride efflux transporter CrcB [Thermoleophilia bacterium]